MTHYIVAAVGNWNRRIFQEKATALDGDFYFVETPEELVVLLEQVRKLLQGRHGAWQHSSAPSERGVSSGALGRFNPREMYEVEEGHDRLVNPSKWRGKDRELVEDKQKVEQRRRDRPPRGAAAARVTF